MAYSTQNMYQMFDIIPNFVRKMFPFSLKTYPSCTNTMAWDIRDEIRSAFILRMVHQRVRTRYTLHSLIIYMFYVFMFRLIFFVFFLFLFLCFGCFFFVTVKICGHTIVQLRLFSLFSIHIFMKTRFLLLKYEKLGYNVENRF